MTTGPPSAPLAARPDPAPAEARPAWCVALVGPLAAVVFWGLGALPWIVSGTRTTLPPAWAGTGGSSAGWMPLPYETSQLALLVLVTVVGGVFAVSCALVAGRDPNRLASRGPVLAAVVGGAVAALVAVAASHTTLTTRLGTARDAGLLVAGLDLAAALGSILGLTLGWVITRTGPVPRTLALAACAFLLPSWLVALVAGVAPTGSPLAQAVTSGSSWLSGILLGLALAALGLRPPGRALAWVAALAIAWVMGPLQTAVFYLGSLLRPQVASRDGLLDALDASRQVFWLAVTQPGRPIGAFVLAVVIGLVGALAVGLVRRRS